MQADPPDPDSQADGADDGETEDENAAVLDEVEEDTPPATGRSAAVPEDGSTIAEELTGLAASTDEDLTSLFRDASKRHFTDGFHGGSDDDEDARRQHRDDTGRSGPPA